jgi:membrane-associated phospholipid phosphatase
MVCGGAGFQAPQARGRIMPNWWYDLGWVLPFRHEALTPVFVGLSAIGTLLGNILFILVFAWVWRADFINRFLPWIGVSVVSNSWLKLYFGDPRPPAEWWIPGYSAGGFGVPSGHAQAAVLFWGAIAYGLYRYQGWRWRLAFPILLALLIGLSRNYLGVHDLQDVMIGNLIGGLLLLLFLLFETRDIQQKPQTVLIIFFLFVSAAYATWPRGNPLEVVVPALALVTGWYGTRMMLAPHPQMLDGDLFRKLLYAVAGLAILFLFRAGINQFLTDWQATSALLFGVGMLGCLWPRLTQAKQLKG